MPKPSDDLTDEQIHQGLTTGEYQGRDALVAEEILRRRHEERSRTGKYRLGFVGAIVAAVLLWLKVRVSGANQTFVFKLRDDCQRRSRESKVQQPICQPHAEANPDTA